MWGFCLFSQHEGSECYFIPLVHQEYCCIPSIFLHRMIFVPVDQLAIGQKCLFQHVIYHSYIIFSIPCNHTYHILDGSLKCRLLVQIYTLF